MHQRAWRVAMLLFVSLAIHNYPEGLAVAASSKTCGASQRFAVVSKGVALRVEAEDTSKINSKENQKLCVRFSQRGQR